jgi:predicted nucleic acid-binding Zn ribbon protein
MSEEPQRIKGLLGEFGQRVGIAGAAETGVLFQRWPEVVGDDIAQHAEPTSLKAGVLRIRTESSSWATEIGYLGPEITRRANELVGRELVNEVRVWTGPGPIEARSRVKKTTQDPPPRPVPKDPIEAFRAAYKAWRTRGR